MKDHSSQYFYLSAIACTMLLVFTPQLFAEVYKTIDENGNVVYTDRQPSPDARPLVLPGLSVISAQKPAMPPVIPGSVLASTGPEAELQQQVPTIEELRRRYRDFAIVSPVQDQTFTGTGNEASVEWNTGDPPQPGMSVIIYLDGVALPATSYTVITVCPLNRGKHNVYAVLTDALDRRIARTRPVSFHIRQNSVNFPNRQSQGG